MVTKRGGGGLLESSVEARRLLNTLQCSFPPILPPPHHSHSRTKNYPATLSTVPARLEKSWFKHIVTF